MTTIKVFTDIEQSRKLADILPIESADMCFNDNEPCWSLAALLSVIKPINENTYTIRGTLDGGAIISFDEATSVMFQEEEIIDAVFEMVVWLKEIRKL